MKRGLGGSCCGSRNLRRVFSQTQMREKNRGPRLAEMARLQMKGRLRALTFSKFSPKRMENAEGPESTRWARSVPSRWASHPPPSFCVYITIAGPARWAQKPARPPSPSKAALDTRLAPTWTRAFPGGPTGGLCCSLCGGQLTRRAKLSALTAEKPQMIEACKGAPVLCTPPPPDGTSHFRLAVSTQ